MERRRPETRQPSSPLPRDYLKMVNEVFSANFDDSVTKLSKFADEEIRFEASGAVFPNEVILSVSLVVGEHLSATTVHASADFDPKASSPTVQDLLSICVDAIAGVYQPLLSTESTDSQDRIESLLSTSMATMEDVPFEWTQTEIDKRKIFIKMDKTNPKLEEIADDWLKKHDPELAQQEVREEKETEGLFITGPKPAKK